MSALLTTPPPLMAHHSAQCHACSTLAVLQDATNTNLRTGKRSVGYMQPYSTKRVTFPTSSARSQVSDPQLQKLLTPRPIFSKAPPTILMSSAARSQDQGLDLKVREPEHPYLQGVVPFPYSLLDSDGDIEMLDGTYYPRASNMNLPIPYPLPSLSTPPSLMCKRRSAGSVSSFVVPSSGRDKWKSAKRKARKSQLHAEDMWWLRVIHRSILHALGESDPTASPSQTSASASDGNGEVRQTCCNSFQAQDLLLAGRISQKMLNCRCHSAAMIDDHEEKTAAWLYSLLAVSSLPPTLVTSALASHAPTSGCRAGLDPQNMSATLSSNGGTVLELADPLCPDANVSHRSKLSIPILVPPSRNRGDFQMLPWPLGPALRNTITPPPSPVKSRRSLSFPLLPPKPPTPRTLRTLTMSQLVASLTLAHRERSGLRPRSSKSSSKRSSKDREKDAHCTGEPASHPSGVFMNVQRHQHADRRSPLSRIAYVDELSC